MNTTKSNEVMNTLNAYQEILDRAIVIFTKIAKYEFKSADFFGEFDMNNNSHFAYDYYDTDEDMVYFSWMNYYHGCGDESESAKLPLSWLNLGFDYEKEIAERIEVGNLNRKNLMKQWNEEEKQKKKDLAKQQEQKEKEEYERLKKKFG